MSDGRRDGLPGEGKGEDKGIIISQQGNPVGSTETEEQKKEREKEERKKAVEEAAKQGYGTINTNKEKYDGDKKT